MRGMSIRNLVAKYWFNELWHNESFTIVDTHNKVYVSTPHNTVYVSTHKLYQESWRTQIEKTYLDNCQIFVP